MLSYFIFIKVPFSFFFFFPVVVFKWTVCVDYIVANVKNKSVYCIFENVTKQISNICIRCGMILIKLTAVHLLAEAVSFFMLLPNKEIKVLPAFSYKYSTTNPKSTVVTSGSEFLLFSMNARKISGPLSVQMKCHFLLVLAFPCASQLRMMPVSKSHCKSSKSKINLDLWANSVFLLLSFLVIPQLLMSSNVDQHYRNCHKGAPLSETWAIF